LKQKYGFGGILIFRLIFRLKAHEIKSGNIRNSENMPHCTRHCVITNAYCVKFLWSFEYHIFCVILILRLKQKYGFGGILIFRFKGKNEK